MSSTSNLCAREKAQKLYKTRMEAVCGPSQDYTEEAALDPTHEQAHAEAVALFDSLATFGKDQDRAAAKDELISNIKEIKEQMYRENQLKMDQSLVKYAPAVLIIVP